MVCIWIIKNLKIVDLNFFFISNKNPTWQILYACSKDGLKIKLHILNYCIKKKNFFLNAFLYLINLLKENRFICYQIVFFY